MKTNNNLPYPFNVAFERGDTIDYNVGRWSDTNDHEYVEKLGYHSEMCSDCSYYAKGLDGFSLSSYGDWGSFHTSSSGKKEKGMFQDMFEKDIIRLWRIRAYIKEDGETNTYDYSTDIGWRTYDKGEGKWVDCEDPYKRIEDNKL